MSVPDVLPPSPPSTNHRHRLSMPFPFKPAVCTPDELPASFLPSSGTGSRKRVEFSPWPNVVDPLTSTPSSDMATVKALPPSRDCQTNSKSILKPYAEPSVSNSSLDESNDKLVASPETLEMISQQLSNNNKGSSLDAYQMLSQIIKAYDEIPEDVNTRSCIANILRCIKRDLSMQDQTQSSPIDTNLMTQALKVSVILVWSEHLSPLLTDEFRVFIIDRSINALAEHTAPKVIVIHYMHLLAMQNFRSTILSSNNRAVKLLEALQDITNHVQGKGAMSERLLIYQKLIEQARPVMKARANLWIKEVLLGLSSSVKDLRDKAISVSTRACAAFPSIPHVSAAAREALASTIPDRTGNERTVSAVLTQRLEKMVAAKDEAAQVPQIWPLVMLLCNSTDTRLESWNLLRDWLKVIQRCFNCSDTSVRSQALPAWNRFICISKPHEASETIMSMLAKPIVAQIERTNSNTLGKGLRPAAISSYYMLLYYAFRPAATHKQYTKMWNEYIVKIMGSQFLSKSTANADMCARIVMSLMWKDSSASRIWNENRAHENTFLEPEDLPATDCKWVRSKAEAILQIFRLLFKHSVWGPSVQHSDQAHVAKAWRNFSKAIKESASKEIKPSSETRKAIQQIAQLIKEVSETGGFSPMRDGRAQLVCNIAVAELGSLCFLEALESDIGLRSPVMLGELLRFVLPKMQGPEHRVPQYFQRCVKLLGEVLQKTYEEFDHNSTDLRSVIDTVSKTVKSIPANTVLASLHVLQSGLALVLEDNKNLAKLGSDSPSLLVSWTELSDTTVNRLASLPLSSYKELDDLLSAIMLSRNIFTTNSLLRIWNAASCSEATISYGPRLLEAFNTVKSDTDINLPGVPIGSQNLMSQVQRMIQTNSIVEEDLEPATVPSLNPQNEATAASANLNPVRMVVEVVGDAPRTKDEPKCTIKDNVNRPRHNDSQTVFVPMNGLARFVDEIESQLLTERQKEVRDRQRGEQSVTFPDLGSSPRSRSMRGSRATSADWELARKVAAVDNLPSTPTIIRQNDAADEDELPSPTPKARNKSHILIDVEIFSSPPSATGNRRIGAVGLDVLSSPPKARNEADVDMVNLEDTVLAEQETPDEQGGVIPKQPRTTVLGKPKEHEFLAEPHMAVDVDMCVINSDLGSTVLETAQKESSRQSVVDAGGREHSPAGESDHNAAGDDIDELSASQLSQSLESHIAEEALFSETPTRMNYHAQTSLKQRKRAKSGCSSQDRSKRLRRAASRNETSMSSIASDESHMANGDLSDDCIVVDTSSPTMPLRRKQADDADSAIPTTSNGRRPRLRRRKEKSVALHVRSRSFEIADDDLATVETNANSQQATPRAPSQKEPFESADNRIKSGHATIEDSSGDQYATPSLSHTKFVEEDVPQPRQVETSTYGVNGIMAALQMALDGLKSISKEQQTNIDLRAIDDLCFKIRYQAQETKRRDN